MNYIEVIGMVIAALFAIYVAVNVALFPVFALVRRSQEKILKKEYDDLTRDVLRQWASKKEPERRVCFYNHFFSSRFFLKNRIVKDLRYTNLLAQDGSTEVFFYTPLTTRSIFFPAIRGYIKAMAQYEVDLYAFLNKFQTRDIQYSLQFADGIDARELSFRDLQEDEIALLQAHTELFSRLGLAEKTFETVTRDVRPDGSYDPTTRKTKVSE